MPWTAYKIVFHLKSPLHVGSKKIGNIQHTRAYVTGRALWGALVARLTRDFFTPPGKYDEIGERVHHELAFSYFFPALADGTEVWLPWLQQSQEYAWQFLGSYSSTALTDGHAAEAASLHETEFISARTRENQPVFLVGYIFEHAAASLAWRVCLDRLQIGSERGYGWGRVQVIAPPAASLDCFGFHLDLNGTIPKLHVPSGGHLPAHAELFDAAPLVFKAGSVEPFLGREWAQSHGPGHRVSQAHLCWTPGSRTNQDSWFQIGRFGILRPDLE